jgi:hypothetical protein
VSRTLNQRMADAHEADMAEDIAGSLTGGSGNQWHRQGDARNNEREVPFPITGDCKATLGKSISVTLFMWRKIVEQTFGQIPTLWLRWYKDEGLRTIEEDLVVLRRRDFKEILDAARDWEGMQNGLKDFILKGEDWTSYSIAEQEKELHPLLEVTLPAPDGVCGVGGCDCCR